MRSEHFFSAFAKCAILNGSVIFGSVLLYQLSKLKGILYTRALTMDKDG